MTSRPHPALNPVAVCANADYGDCDGPLVERATGIRTTVTLCAFHLAENDFITSGIVPALKALAATEPARKRTPA